MRKYYNIIMLILLLVLPLASAETFNYRVGISNNLKFVCTLNNQIPSSSTIYNITIDYPNGSTLLNNVQTTSIGNGLFNYTITFNTNGIYKIHQFCLDSTSNANYSNTDDYIISQTGSTPSLTQGIIYIVLLILAGALTYSFYIFARNIDSENFYDKLGYISKVNYKKHVKTFLFSISYLSFIWFIWVAYQIAYGFLPVELGISQILYTIWIICFYSLYVLMIIWFIVLPIMFIRTLIENARIMKGHRTK